MSRIEAINAALKKETPAERSAALKKVWGKEAANLLRGRVIVDVRYMTKKEQEDVDFHSAGVVLVLDNGHIIYPSMDDEGNNAGAMHTTFEDLPIIPVI